MGLLFMEDRRNSLFFLSQYRRIIVIYFVIIVFDRNIDVGLGFDDTGKEKLKKSFIMFW